jgi:hypothetical protein
MSNWSEAAKRGAVSTPKLELQLANISALKHVFILTNSNSAQESKQLKQGPKWEDMKKGRRRDISAATKALNPKPTRLRYATWQC